jgi:uncharacterized membrane protein HdeD (DUF308 family)
MHEMKRSKSSVVLTGIASVLMGLIFFTNPSGATVALTRLIGWISIALGILTLIASFRDHSPIGSSVDFYGGLASLIFGLLLALQPALFVAWVFILIGIFIVVEGFNMMLAANVGRAAGLPGASAQTAIAVVLMILGIIVSGSPFAMINLAGFIAGITLIVNGIADIARSTKM